MRDCVAIRYAVEGDLRFVSHQDMMRLFERALARADFPVSFSEGFNPRPRMSALLPRPVGVASNDETLIVELCRDEEVVSLLQRLTAQMPFGLRLLSIDKPFHFDPRQELAVEYAVPIGTAHEDELTRRIEELMSAKSYLIDRTSPKYATKKVDIRCFLLEMRISQGWLIWTQLVLPEGTTRVGEVLDAVGLSSRDHIHRVIRKAVSPHAPSTLRSRYAQRLALRG